MSKLEFPAGFQWGVATSSYQIEGAWNEDGKGPSIWDTFVRQPGRIRNGDTGDVACDHYHRYKEDVALLKWLGVKAYRLSINWPRILPAGRGPVNLKGLDFYQRLVDELLGAGITPCITLYHWELPQALEDEGGWPARHVAECFADYVDVTTRALGDRVKWWLTHNEPWCSSFLDYQVGIHAPGRKSWREGIAASHHVLLSHGLAVPIIRQNSPGADVGIALNMWPGVPASPSPEDMALYLWDDGYTNRWLTDPVFGRGYPADMVADFAVKGFISPSMSELVKDGDLKKIAAPIDSLGINFYGRHILRSAAIPESQNAPRTVNEQATTDNGWEICPDALWELLTQVHLHYRPRKIFITENGACFKDGPDADGRIRDGRRVDFLRGHIAALHRAIGNGVPLQGYFQWSMMDNFEWAEGYEYRFGLIHVDFETQKRTPKDSAHFYKQVIGANAVDSGR